MIEIDKSGFGSKAITSTNRGDRFVLDEVGHMTMGEFDLECMCHPQNPLINRYLDLVSSGYGYGALSDGSKT